MAQAVLDPASEAAILSRTIDPSNGNWCAEAARSILAIEMSQLDLERASELAGKAREGSLTEAERVELDSYRHVGRLLELMKAKARVSLRESTAHPKANDGD